MPEKLTAVLTKFCNEYVDNTPKKLKIIDAYLLYILLTGVIQFGYCALVGTFPFNSFLSGFTSCVGSFIITGATYKPWYHPCRAEGREVYHRASCGPSLLEHIRHIKD